MCSFCFLALSQPGVFYLLTLCPEGIPALLSEFSLRRGIGPYYLRVASKLLFSFILIESYIIYCITCYIISWHLEYISAFFNDFNFCIIMFSYPNLVPNSLLRLFSIHIKLCIVLFISVLLQRPKVPFFGASLFSSQPLVQK